MLQRSGYRVMSLYEGRNKRVRTLAVNCDIILLDVQLPDITGDEIAIQIRSHASSKNQETPIILFSANTGMTEEETKSCGANDYLGKPFLPDDLLYKIKKHLKSAKT